MRFTRARYVTICQQFLVTASVGAVALSAAGVMTLQIVAPEQRVAPAVEVGEAYVATKPVTPKVREVKVAPRVTARPASGGRVSAVSKPTAVHGYATVGVTWKSGTKLAEDQIKVQVRTRKNGAWSGWQTAAYHDEHGPDAGTPEAARAQRPGTDAVVIGDVDQVQMRAETTTGSTPADLELAVIDPGVTNGAEEPAAIDTSKLDQGVEGGAEPAAAHGDGAAAGIRLAAMQTAPRPYIYSRGQWGANESLRDKSSLRYGTIKTGFIHHTVNANSYTREQVPALIRGIYAYHTQSRGWSDIGYNFLVDRFGRIWEGRYGGVDKAVVGAHTLGYNEYSFAMSAIGNFDVAEPPQAVLDAYAKLYAWKLSLYGIPANGTHRYVKDRYLNAINGHRDVGQTACPGRYLYADIPAIRAAAARIQGGAQLTGDPVNWPILPVPSGSAKPTQAPAPAVAQPSMSFPARTSLAGEHWPDLIIKSPTDMIRVVPTHGIRTYKTRIVSNGVWWSKDLIVAVGDLTGDGKSDVLARNAKTRETAVYRGDGKGHVSTTGIATTAKFAGLSNLVAARDFNSDGKLDVLGKSRVTGGLMLFRGAGGGKFARGVTISREWPYTGTTAVGDFNGDKLPDLMALADGTTLYLFPGRTGGLSLGPKVLVEKSALPLSGLLSWGDLTGDAYTDVMARTASTGLGNILAGKGGGKFGQTWGSFSGFSSLKKTSLAPMVGSPAADVVGRDGHGRLVVVANSGKGNITGSLKANLKLPAASQVINVGDWDRNGRGDVIIRSSAGDLLVWYPGHADGTFGRGHSLGTGWSGVRNLSAVGDVTGDGFPDLIGRIDTGPWQIFPGNGSKGFKAPRVAPASMRTYNQVGTGTWTPQGGAALRSTNSSIVPVVGSTVGDALRAANGSVDTAYDNYVGLGDADGDGVADVLAREKGTGIIWLLPGKTTGGFAPRLWVANGFAGYQLIG